MDVKNKYPVIYAKIFSYLGQDWSNVYPSITSAVLESLKYHIKKAESVDDIYKLGLGSLEQLYSEIFDIVKRKNVDDQWDLYKQLEYGGPIFQSKWQVECFFTTILYLTETEMRKRGLEIPENPPLHMATA